jgi:hypothetical protein
MNTVQMVQKIQADQTPFFFLPASARREKSSERPKRLERSEAIERLEGLEGERQQEREL